MFKMGLFPEESGAFRGIRRSPRLLLIQNINRIAVIPPLTFAGLGRIQHFWWRNVSIGQVQSHAFAKLWPLGYLYFRQVHIQVGYAQGKMKILDRKWLLLALAKCLPLSISSFVTESNWIGFRKALLGIAKLKAWFWKMHSLKDLRER